MKEKEDFSTTNILRIYDTQLITMLNESYKSKRYESKNHFLNELIAAGLERKQSIDDFKQKLDWKETLLTESMRQLAERMASLETYIQNQCSYFHAVNSVILITPETKKKVPAYLMKTALCLSRRKQS